MVDYQNSSLKFKYYNLKIPLKLKFTLQIKRIFKILDVMVAIFLYLFYNFYKANVYRLLHIYNSFELIKR